MIVWTFYRPWGLVCCQERAWELAAWLCGHAPAEPSNVSGPEYIPSYYSNSLLRGQKLVEDPVVRPMVHPLVVCIDHVRRRSRDVSVWRLTQGDGYLHFGRRSQRDQALDTRPVPDFWLRSRAWLEAKRSEDTFCF